MADDFDPPFNCGDCVQHVPTGTICWIRSCSPRAGVYSVMVFARHSIGWTFNWQGWTRTPALDLRISAWLPSSDFALFSTQLPSPI